MTPVFLTPLFPRLKPAHVLLALLGLFTAHARGADCAWLPVAQVEAALPQQKPWSADAGSGAGACGFSSAARTSGKGMQGYPKLTFSQQHHASAAAARDSVKLVRDEGPTADYTIERLGALGAEALVLVPTARAMKPQNTSWMTHRDSVTLFVSWTDENPLSTTQRSAIESLIAAAQNRVTQADVKASTLTCAYWDEGAVKKLLVGKDFRVQQQGVDHCAASVSAGPIVSLTVSTERDAQAVQSNLLALRSGFCRHNALPEFGASAALEHGCTTGAEQNTVLFATGLRVNRLVLDVLRPGAEPSAAQRELLLQIARSVVKKAGA